MWFPRTLLGLIHWDSDLNHCWLRLYSTKKVFLPLKIYGSPSHLSSCFLWNKPLVGNWTVDRYLPFSGSIVYIDGTFSSALVSQAYKVGSQDNLHCWNVYLERNVFLSQQFRVFYFHQNRKKKSLSPLKACLPSPCHLTRLHFLSLRTQGEFKAMVFFKCQKYIFPDKAEYCSCFSIWL